MRVDKEPEVDLLQVGIFPFEKRLQECHNRAVDEVETPCTHIAENFGEHVRDRVVAEVSDEEFIVHGCLGEESR